MEILVAVLIGAVIWNCVVIERLIREFRRQMADLRQEFSHTKQSRAASTVSLRGVPKVDSKGRTTRRDSSDIPVRGGRMSKLTSKRNPDDSVNRDRRLPDNPGHSTEELG